MQLKLWPRHGRRIHGGYVHIYFGFEENAKCSGRFKGRTAVFAPWLPSPTRHRELQIQSASKLRAYAEF